jgi:hypothetical protein
MKPRFQASSDSRRCAGRLGSVARRPPAPGQEPRANQAHADQQERDRSEAREGKPLVSASHGNLSGGLSRTLVSFAGNPLVGVGSLVGTGALVTGALVSASLTTLSKNGLRRGVFSGVFQIRGAARAGDTRDRETSSGPAQQKTANQHHRHSDSRFHKSTPPGRVPTRCLAGRGAEPDAVQFKCRRSRRLLAQSKLELPQFRIDLHLVETVHHGHIRMGSPIPDRRT